MAMKKRKDVNPKEGERKYGDVKFADPTNKKYPIDTEEHIRAAWNYIHKAKDSDKYSASEVAAIKRRIVAAWKEKIDKDGPPSADEHSVPVGEIVVFSAGKHTTKSGKTVVVTDDDLDNIVANYSADEPPSYIIGHSSDYPGKTLIPAFGRIKQGLKRVGHNLVAVGSEFSEVLASWVRDGFYTERSAEIQDLPDGGKKLMAVSMLGAQPPAVKGMPSIMSAIENPAFAFSADTNVEEFAETEDDDIPMGEHLEAVRDAAKEHAKKNMSEIAGRHLSAIEDHIDNDDDGDEVPNRIMQMASEMHNEYRKHRGVIDTMDDMDDDLDDDGDDYSAPTGVIQEIRNLIFGEQRKESDMDKKERDAYEAKIADLQAKVSEFSAHEEQARLEKEAIEKKAADEKLRASVHEFCESHGLTTNKAKELKVEDTLYHVAKAEGMVEFSESDKKPVFEALKGIFDAMKVAPVTGELSVFASPDPSNVDEMSAFTAQAKEYIETHPQEFQNKTLETAIGMVRVGVSEGRIKFSNKK